MEVDQRENRKNISCGLRKVSQLRWFQSKRGATGKNLTFSEALNVYQNAFERIGRGVWGYKMKPSGDPYH